ncbi:zinc-binding dehydrogenase [Naumannella halotolerans]|uniref:Alcohol dehydrogenase n=1 Tax=Naumannella halotolerans TaxID=993414 RepID=A0A4R7IYH8_9ACTN|nr:alcohol dehydrogenase catalytic domain-containing protein [Naumannella halotolerans]TDT29822.1 alcohol dehydrogenase [Naumannella halotolerans]
MLALQYDRFGGPIEVRELPAPDVPAGAVRLTVAASGLCRSDWHAWAGHDTDVALPHVPGHEFSGVVDAVGSGVERWRSGQRVTAPFVQGCGRCRWCLTGQAQVCPDQTQAGFTHAGSHAEYVIVHAADANLVAVGDDISDQVAASLGCRFATAFRALHGPGRVRAGEWVVVVGAGGVGLSAVMIAAAMGARPIAVDRSPAALAMAAAVGAEAVVTAGDRAAEEIAELTGGGAQVSVDAVGHPSTAELAIGVLRRQGRHMQIGLFDPASLPVLDWGRVIGWELQVNGSHGMSAADYPPLLELISSGRLRPQELITGTVGLSEAASLLPRTDVAPPTGVTLIDPTRV